MTARLWQVLDMLVHLARLPQPWTAPVCDRYDLALGATPDELRRR